MRLIDADKAPHGTTIVADYQTAGRGQRGKSWMATAGESLMMSVITVPQQTIDAQFIFSALVAVSIVETIQQFEDMPDAQIKWPNDIIVNDRKAGGILIENVLRGLSWLYAIIGLGLNLNQDFFGEELPHAISLKIASGKNIGRDETATLLRTALLCALDEHVHPQDIMRRYNKLLFRRGRLQEFMKDGKEWAAMIIEVHADGLLEVQLGDGSTDYYTHGTAIWKY